jgi:HEPN domain-containing protein
MKPAVMRWLQLAELDLKAAKLLRKDAGLTPVVCFHAQQCIEKLLKALIESEALNPPKSHDLILLHAKVTSLIQLDEDLLSELNQVYIDARYPASIGLLPNGLPGSDDAKKFYNFANTVYGKVKKILG